MEMSFPPDAAQLDPYIGVVFLATDNENRWLADVYPGGKAGLYKLTNNKFSTVWETMTNNLVKTGATDVNSVRAVVKPGTITVIVNGQTVKSVRAQIPGGNLMFGFAGYMANRRATPVSFSVRSYKVTAVE